MAIQIYLIVNAVMYLAFAAWCTLAPMKTSAAIGFQFANNGARSEYVAVYGGLEAGLAAFFLLGAIRSDLQWPALLFGVCLYTGLVLWRLGTILTLADLPTLILGLFALEAIGAVAGWWLVVKS